MEFHILSDSFFIQFRYIPGKLASTLEPHCTNNYQRLGQRLSFCVLSRKQVLRDT